MKLEVVSTQTINNYTTTAIASSPTAAVCSVDGKEVSYAAGEGQVLVLVVDGVQKDLVPGKVYEEIGTYEIVPVAITRVGGPSAAPWVGAKEEEKASYYFRQALLVDGGAIVEDASVTQAIVGGSYDAAKAEGVTIDAGGTHFNGILIDNGTTFEIADSKFYSYGDGGDDLSGWGASIMADNKSDLTLRDSYIETAGAIRCALYVDNTSIARVSNTVIYTKETPDTYEEYANLTPAMMKRVPFALGMEGTVRSLNVMADGQGKFENCIIISTGWGAISTDSGTAYDACHTYALDVNNTLSGIGTMEIAEEGKEYTAVRELGGVTYGFTVGGSGYVTYADSGVHNRYTNVEFYSPDYIQVMGSGRTGSTYIDSYLYSGHTAFMTQQTGGGTFELINTKVDAEDALIQIKSGAANTGFSNIVVDKCEICFSGKSTRAANGILAELVESDDAGNPGITTYTINDHAEEAAATSSEVADCTASFKNGEYSGDIFNSIYNYKQTLNVVLENAVLDAVISSTTAIHVDLEGNVVPNGTVLNAFMGSKEFDHVNYAAAQGGMSGDCKLIGRFRHTPAAMLNNPINVTLTDSAWNVTGACYLNAVEADADSEIRADKPVTVQVKALTLGGKSYEDGTYTIGNVTFVVDSTVIEVEDNGIADAGQTYGNVVYTFYAATEEGELDSKAVSLKRQNYIDGNLYFKMIPAEGVEIVSFTAERGSVEPNTAGGELAAYDYVMTPDQGAVSMEVHITVKK